MKRKNHMNCALTGVATAQLVYAADHRVIGETYKKDKFWYAWAGYDLPAEFRGSWDYKVEAIAAINEANRLSRVSYVGEM